MKCPKCKKEVVIPNYAYRNVETYNTVMLTASECCGTFYIVNRTVQFQVTKYTGDKTTDDWGINLNKK